jgi:DNA-binding transcriptional regulator YiaG
MTGIELKKRIAALALPSKGVAAVALGVVPSTLRKWERSKEVLPHRVELAFRHLERMRKPLDVDSLKKLRWSDLEKKLGVDHTEIAAALDFSVDAIYAYRAGRCEAPRIVLLAMLSLIDRKSSGLSLYGDHRVR